MKLKPKPKPKSDPKPKPKPMGDGEGDGDGDSDGDGDRVRRKHLNKTTTLHSQKAIAEVIVSVFLPSLHRIPELSINISISTNSTFFTVYHYGRAVLAAIPLIIGITLHTSSCCGVEQTELG